MTAYIFPAFGTEYTGKEQRLPHLARLLPDYLKRASEASSFDPAVFAVHPRGDFDDELQSQLSCYVLSCAAARALSAGGGEADWAAGYSMGLYAALEYSGVIGFEDGLCIIEQAYRAIRGVAGEGRYAVGTIVGFEAPELIGMIIESGLCVEVVNTNNSLNHMVAGKSDEIDVFLDRVCREGAMSVRKLPFLAPYHTTYVRPAAAEVGDFLENIKFRVPRVPLISPVDRGVIADADAARDEIVRNVSHPIDWMAVMNSLSDRGVRRYLECGPGRSLHRMSGLMDGDFDVRPLHRIG